MLSGVTRACIATVTSLGWEQRIVAFANFTDGAERRGWLRCKAATWKLRVCRMIWRRRRQSHICVHVHLRTQQPLCLFSSRCMQQNTHKKIKSPSFRFTLNLSLLSLSKQLIRALQAEQYAACLLTQSSAKR